MKIANIARISDQKIISKHCIAKPHMSSVFYEREMRNILYSSDCIVYGQLHEISARNLASQITMVPSISVILFSNQLMITHTGIQCNAWLNFNVDEEHARHIVRLHSVLNKTFSRFLHDLVRTDEDENILKFIIRILFEEDGIEKRMRSQTHSLAENF